MTANIVSTARHLVEYNDCTEQAFGFFLSWAYVAHVHAQKRFHLHKPCSYFHIHTHTDTHTRTHTLSLSLTHTQHTRTHIHTYSTHTYSTHTHTHTHTHRYYFLCRQWIKASSRDNVSYTEVPLLKVEG